MGPMTIPPKKHPLQPSRARPGGPVPPGGACICARGRVGMIGGAFPHLIVPVPHRVNGSTRLTWFPALPALFVLAVVVALPGRAAACGSYVQTRAQRPCSRGDCPPAPVSPVPCTGPSCRAKQESLPVAPAPAPPTAPQWALGLAASDQPSRLASRVAPVVDGGRALHRVFPPDPPPRHA